MLEKGALFDLSAGALLDLFHLPAMAGSVSAEKEEPLIVFEVAAKRVGKLELTQVPPAQAWEEALEVGSLCLEVCY